MPILRKELFASAILAANFLLAGPSYSAEVAPFLSDDFGGSSVNPDLWFIPARDPAGDGTFVGRTQFRVAQDSLLPAISDGNACISLETYNPRAFSFYGTEIITRKEFAPGNGLDIIVRAKMKNARYGGIVGGIFLYFLNPGSDTLHDEIDFELLTNEPGKVQTNIYGDEPLGVGHSQLTPFRSGSIADSHTYEIKWTPGLVSWLVDGELIRTTASNIPTHPMQFHLNIWAPDRGWPQGHSDSIQPVKSKDSNIVLNSLCVDSVVIRPLPPQ